LRFYDGTNWISSEEIINDNTWKHIAIVGNNSSKELKFYLDGSLKKTATFNAITPNGLPLYIGKEQNSKFFEGYLDDIRISKTLRSQEEILRSVYLWNKANEINANFTSFPTAHKKLMFKAFLESDGTSQVQLDNIRIYYSCSSEPKSLTIISPNGGEEWQIGNNYPISWTSTGAITNVKLEYSKDNFVSDINIIATSTENDGHYEWTIPNDPSNTVKVRITDVTDSSISDISDNNFTIKSASAGGGAGGGGSTAGGGGAGGIFPPSTSEEEFSIEAMSKEAEINPEKGGKVEVVIKKGVKASLEIPVGAVKNEVRAIITPIQIKAKAVSSQIKDISLAQKVVGDYVYSFKVESKGQIVSAFEKPVLITLTYTNDQIRDLDEDSLTIYYYNESLSQWLALESSIDTKNNTVSAATNHLTLFALMAKKKPISKMTVRELEAKIAEILSFISQLKAQLANLQMAKIQIQTVKLLSRNLRYGDKGEEVRLLQAWLAKDPKVYPEGLITGWFGPLTRAAVIRFQEKHAGKILAPLGLTKGTGFVGPRTRKILNTLNGNF
jgi:hypothetical protein